MNGIKPLRKPSANETSWKKGKPKTGGRPPGRSNRTTAVLKEAIMLAAELEGWDGKGTDGLTGYLRRAAREEMRAFLPLLGRVLPYTIAQEREVKVDVVYRSVEEVRREMLSRGIDMELIHRIMTQPAGLIDGTVEPVSNDNDGGQMTVEVEGNGHDTLDVIEVQPDGR